MIKEIMMIPSIFFIVIFLVGHLTQCICYKENQGIGYTAIVGFLTVFAVMELILVPMVLLRCTFDVFYWTYSIVILILIGGSFFYWRRMRDSIKTFFSSTDTWVTWLLIFVIIVIAYQFFQLERSTYEEADNAYYINLANDAVLHNEIMGRYPETGVGDGFNIRYGISLWPMTYAVLGKLFNILPTLIATAILPYITIPFTYLLYFMLGRSLFPKEKDLVAYFMTFVALLYMFLSGKILHASPQSLLLTSPWVGKAIAASFFVPLCYYLMLRMKDGSEEKGNWIVLFLATLGASLFTSMNIFLMPLILGGTGLVIAIYKKSISFLGKIILSISPALILGIIYIMY